MISLDSDLLFEFLEEAEEGLSTLNEDLLEIEEEIAAGKDLNSETLNEMFRVAHSIKGASAFFGLTSVNGLTHELESLMDIVRTGGVVLTNDHTNLLFDALDVLTMSAKASAAGLGETKVIADLVTSALIASLTAIVEPGFR